MRTAKLRAEFLEKKDLGKESLLGLARKRAEPFDVFIRG